ncbi:MAG: DUF1592 domain-containing protein [Acidimicrobiia bacterium]|nr:DUF1592 domain-containing protein [Acidimicrobiia bacterium]
MVQAARWMRVATLSVGIGLTASPHPAFAQSGGSPASSASATSVATAPPSTTATQALIKRYCVACHSERLRTGGLSLETLDPARVSSHAAVWEKVLTRLRSASMPPAGAPRPDPATYVSTASWLESELDRAAAAAPNPGRLPLVHRLNRAEYRNALRDLLALDHLPRELDVEALLPVDDVSYGFDNMADALGTSPTLIERYLLAAQKMAALAVGDMSAPVIVDRYRVPLAMPQDDRFEELPFGSRGGFSVERFFPLDGEYTFQAALTAGRITEPHQLELSIDGERVQLFTISETSRAGRNATPPPMQARVMVKAGTHVVTVTFLKKTGAVGEEVLRPFTRSGQGASPTQPALESVTITGPLNATGPGDTPSRRRIFACRPGASISEAACAEQILTTLARRAYRRPATAADLRTLMPFYKDGRAEGSFDRGIQRALERLLVSPAFLFRIERASAPNTPAAARAASRGTPTNPDIWRVSDLELASRLSFFLWSSIPDDELLDLASRGRLSETATLEGQVRRMLADPRANALGENFAAQWLSLRSLDDSTPDPRLFPDFDEGLRKAMRRETELFFNSVVRENRSALDLLTATDTFVNERLARHYGVPGVYGDGFKRVTRSDAQRTGILGHASILTVTSYAHRTSPVLRGKWVMENVLGTPPPPPPPDVPTLVETNKATGKALTMREAMALHRANPTCASCHGRMDPLGFAFENFDAVGRWRTVSADAPVDASGVLPDGTKFDGARGLLDVILKRPEQFAGTLTERLLTYALGRGLEYYDTPTVRAVVREAGPRDYTFTSIVTGIVKSVPFQMRGRDTASSSPSSTGAPKTVAAK